MFTVYKLSANISDGTHYFSKIEGLSAKAVELLNQRLQTKHIQTNELLQQCSPEAIRLNLTESHEFYIVSVGSYTLRVTALNINN
jgi:hypothetical protein